MFITGSTPARTETDTEKQLFFTGQLGRASLLPGPSPPHPGPDRRTTMLK